MNKQERVALAIKGVVSKMMDRVMENVLVNDPFVKEKHHASKPLYAALVPDEIFKGSHFERRFVTPFGGVWEKLAQVVAIEAHGSCSMGHTIIGNVGAESLRRIQEVLNKLEHNVKGKDKAKPDWKTELEYIKQGGGEPISVSVTCDIFIHNEMTDVRYAFELKAPLPNSDQTKVSKEKMFKLLAMNPPQVDYAFYALAYNPYGRKEDYKWGFPLRWFNMQKDESVLIGDEFWELIGGKGTYSNFIKEVNFLGKEYRERIYREFLQIEPPVNFEDNLLK
ncbi:TdeIII family type II restriction endonuclease [Arcicella sp. LKC2W]|uniref:TdeIII family type II restriction endonuclease n=1 Tax=Arcicella sp. LKC2W TaxID=2984198 RepID=UPI002B210548|nr:TdeIII family type II restriction endonuclease [Arcicella sp. LKC2W]MEA5458077.1 TdeIII family type II restriction endonuclease [Arcicella sp. LKC2W]